MRDAENQQCHSEQEPKPAPDYLVAVHCSVHACKKKYCKEVQLQYNRNDRVPCDLSHY